MFLKAPYSTFQGIKVDHIIIIIHFVFFKSHDYL